MSPTKHLVVMFALPQVTEYIRSPGKLVHVPFAKVLVLCQMRYTGYDVGLVSPPIRDTWLYV